IPFFIVGFLFVTFIPVQNLLPVAVLGAAFAVYEYFNEQKKAAVAAVKAEDMEDGI
ncbi:MAG: PTS N-acetylgalactosamine transporter subunit IIC, partial [Enterobacterales bacterium]|nr:PTS N-acetylgalactosamine transporter subunit IIC [Enterobacterales bacterium]